MGLNKKGGRKEGAGEKDVRFTGYSEPVFPFMCESFTRLFMSFVFFKGAIIIIMKPTVVVK